jgi:tripartite-type tricarboxylate transporter receptor subunit TctC
MRIGHSRRRALLAAAALATAHPIATSARAQPAGAVPVRLVVPGAPGGSTDIAARIVAPAFGEALGRAVLVENRGGAGGVVGAEAVAAAPPDGDTLGFFTVSAAVLIPLLRKDLRFDAIRAFAPVTLVGTMPMLAVCGPHVPARDLPELLDLLRREPGRRTYGSGGAGSLNHLAGHLLAARASASAVHVPYRGAGPAIAGVIAGDVDYLVEGIASLHRLVRDGALRGLAVCSRARSALLPGLPIAAEGGLPDFELLNWFAVFAPAATPAPAIARRSEALGAALRASAVARRLAEDGVDAVGSLPAELGRFWDTQLALWRPVVQASGATAD